MKVAIFLAFCGLSLSSCLAEKRFYVPGNVTIGVLFVSHEKESPLSCGVLDEVGLAYIEAVYYAVQCINNNSQLLPHLTLGVDVWDYCDSTALAMRYAYQMITNIHDHRRMEEQPGVVLENVTAPIVAVIGTLSSSSTPDVSSLLQVVGIPIISPFATSDALSFPYYTSFFRTIPPDEHQATAMADVIEHFNWQYVAAVALDNAYGQFGVRGLEKEAYKRNSFCVAFSMYFTSGGYEGQMKSIVTKLKIESDIKVIVLWSGFSSAKGLLDEAIAQKLFDRTFILSEAMGVLGSKVLEPYSAVLNGSFITFPHEYHYTGFEEHLKQLTPQETLQSKNPWWDEFWKKEFNCSSDSTDKEYTECSNDFRNKNVKGLLFAAYVIDAVYAIAHAVNGIDRCDGRQASNESCLREQQDIHPQTVAKMLRKVSFQGKTGRVQFNDQGNPITARYDLARFQKANSLQSRNSFINIGSWKLTEDSRGQLTINDSIIVWKTDNGKAPRSVCVEACPAGYKQTEPISCCWKCYRCGVGFVTSKPGSHNCTKCPPEKMSDSANTKCVDLPLRNIRFSEPSAILFMSLAGLGILLTLGTAAVFIKYRGTPAVKGANLELSFLLLLMITFSFLLTLLHILLPSNALCYIIEPSRYVTCTFIVSILFLKTNRLVRVFNPTSIPSWFKKYVLDAKLQLATLLLLNFIQIVLTAVWLVLDPPSHIKRITPQVSIVYACQPFNTYIGQVIRAIMFGYFIFMSLLCALYAFKARKLPENFKEARYIGFSMFVLLLSWIAYYPVESALMGSYMTIVACATALLIGYGVLMCMFFTKVFIILLHPEQNTPGFVKAQVSEFSTSSTAISLHAYRNKTMR